MTISFKSKFAAVATAASIVIGYSAGPIFAGQSAAELNKFLLSLMAESVWDVGAEATFEQIETQFNKISETEEYDDDDDEC